MQLVCDGHGRCHVEDKGSVFPPGCPERDHIVANEPSFASRRSHSRPTGGAMNADHVLPGCHEHIIGSRAGVGAIAYARPSRSILPRHPYTLVHGPVAHDESETLIPINRCGRRAAPGDLYRWCAVDGTVLDAPYVVPVKIDYSVRVNSPQIGVNQYLGRQVRIVERHSNFLKGQ